MRRIPDISRLAHAGIVVMASVGLLVLCRSAFGQSQNSGAAPAPSGLPEIQALLRVELLFSLVLVSALLAIVLLWWRTHRDLLTRQLVEARIQRNYSEILTACDALAQQNANLTAANALLQTLVTTDGLTGLKNHRAFQEQVEHEIATAHRYQTPLSLLLIDIDHFKQVNDQHGHPVGDDVLKTLASLLQSNARAADFIARYGGEEFAVLLPYTDEEGAVIIAERLRIQVGATAWNVGPLTVSIGIATLTPRTAGRAELIAQADAALYTSKNHGRNCVTHAAKLLPDGTKVVVNELLRTG